MNSATAPRPNRGLEERVAPVHFRCPRTGKASAPAGSETRGSQQDEGRLPTTLSVLR